MSHGWGRCGAFTPEWERILVGLQKEGAWAFTVASPELKNDREFVLRAVAIRGDALMFVSDDLRHDREVALAAIGQSARAFEHVLGDLRGDREFLLEAISLSPGVALHAPLALRDDKDFMTKAIQRGAPLTCASAKLQGDPALKFIQEARDKWAERREELLTTMQSAADQGDTETLGKALADAEELLAPDAELEAPRRMFASLRATPPVTAGASAGVPTTLTPTAPVTAEATASVPTRGVQAAPAHDAKLSQLDVFNSFDGESAVELDKYNDVAAFWTLLGAPEDSAAAPVVLVKGTWLVELSRRGHKLPRRQDLAEVAAQMGSSENKMREIFDRVDVSKNGRISKIELIKALRDNDNKDIADVLNLPQRIRQEDGTRDLFERVFQDIDANSDRELTWSEFKKLVKVHGAAAGEKDAIWDCSELRQEVEEYQTQQRSRRPPLIVCISHCWLTPLHPDPEGKQLKLIAWFIEHRLKDIDADLAVFIDYCSLMQKGKDGEPRSSDEQQSYELALRNMNLWFAHDRTETWHLAHTPDGVLPYHSRGWPTFEAAVSVLLPSERAHSNMLDIGKVLPRKIDIDWPEIHRCCTWQRGPPIPPQQFGELIASKTFTAEEDANIVLNLYRETFEAVLAPAKSLTYQNLDWGDSEASNLAVALKLCPSLQSLDLTRNQIGDRGFAEVISAVAESTINQLVFNGNRIGDAGVEHLAKTLPKCTSMSSLDVSFNMIGNAGVQHLIDMFQQHAAHPTLQELRLNGNDVGLNAKRSLQAIAQGKQGSNFKLNI